MFELNCYLHKTTDNAFGMNVNNNIDNAKKAWNKKFLPHISGKKSNYWKFDVKVFHSVKISALAENSTWF